MRFKFIIASLLFVVSSAVFAQSDISPAALLGNWSASAQHPSGAVLITSVQLNQNMTFTTSTNVNGAPFMEASGTWKLSGAQLEWRYEQSSHPAIKRGYIDVDEIKTISDTEMVVTSKLSGKTHTYKKVS